MYDYLDRIEYFRQKLAVRRIRCDVRYSHYEMKHRARDLQISTPPQLSGFNSSLGWCAKAVDSIADRLQYMGFSSDPYGMEEVFNYNNPDNLFDDAILSALVTSCSFIYISMDEDDNPTMQVIDGRYATGDIDPVTKFLNEGYAVLEVDRDDRPMLEAYFTAEETVYYPRGEEPYSVTNPTNYPLLVPVLYRPDSKRPFGHSRISRACMDIADGASRTLKRSEISAEFYSYPQKYALGLDDDIEGADKWRASMSAMLTIGRDEDGNLPTLGSFQQASQQPHLDQMRSYASLFAAETGLTIDDLGFPNSNPSSVEAIKASHEALRLTARKAQRIFSICFMNAGLLAISLRDEYPYTRLSLKDTKISWMPLFEHDSASLSAIGDGIIKINTAVPGYIDNDAMYELTGIKGAD